MVAYRLLKLNHEIQRNIFFIWTQYRNYCFIGWSESPCNDEAAPAGGKLAMRQNLGIDGVRLSSRLDQLAQIGAIAGGGACRLALTDEDKDGRDLVVRWM